jgi:hypothetical protein
MKFSADKLYIKPNPISALPIGIPYLGFLNVTKATSEAMRIGNGCGKSGRNDRPNIMLASVIANVRILSEVGSRARSLSSFFFLACLHLLNHAGGRKIFESRSDFTFLPKTLFYENHS